MQPKSSEATGIGPVTVLYGRPFFAREFSEYSQKSLFSSGLTYLSLKN